MQETWQQAAENLEKVLSERDFTTWIKPIRYSHHDDDTVYLSVPTSFFKEWLEENYQQVLIGALSMTTGKNVFINFLIRENDTEADIKLAEDLIIKGLPDSRTNPGHSIRISIYPPEQQVYL